MLWRAALRPRQTICLIECQENGNQLRGTALQHHEDMDKRNQRQRIKRRLSVLRRADAAISIDILKRKAEKSPAVIWFLNTQACVISAVASYRVPIEVRLK